MCKIIKEMLIKCLDHQSEDLKKQRDVEHCRICPDITLLHVKAC